MTDSVCDEPGCSEAPVVGINKRRVCIEHIDMAMAEAFAPLREWRESQPGD